MLENLHLLLENGVQVGPFIERGGVQLLGSILGHRNAITRSKAAFQAAMLAAQCMATVLSVGLAQVSVTQGLGCIFNSAECVCKGVADAQVSAQATIRWGTDGWYRGLAT